MYRFSFRHLGVVALVFTGVLLASTPSAASGCKFPPCGGVGNNTDQRIGVKWTDDDGKTWQYGIAEPGTTIGGFMNDRIDVDDWYIPGGCTDRGVIGGDDKTWSGGRDGKWERVHSQQTVVIYSRTCE